MQRLTEKYRGKGKEGKKKKRRGKASICLKIFFPDVSGKGG